MELDRHADAPPLHRGGGRERLDMGARRRGRERATRRDRTPRPRPRPTPRRCRPSPTGRRARAPACSCARARRAPGGPIRQIRSRPRISSRFWSGVLPKPIPGSRQTCSSGIPAATATASRSSRKAGDLGDDVVVARRDLHRARLSLHVHEANVRARRRRSTPASVRDRRRRAVTSLTSDAPSCEGLPRDLRLRGVDRDRHAGEQLEHRHDAAQLLVERDGLGSRPRRLAADVDERGAFGEQPPRASPPRRAGSRLSPAVREAVGRDVHDAHHRGARPTLRERRTSHQTMER